MASPKAVAHRNWALLRQPSLADTSGDGIKRRAPDRTETRPQTDGRIRENSRFALPRAHPVSQFRASVSRPTKSTEITEYFQTRKFFWLCILFLICFNTGIEFSAPP